MTTLPNIPRRGFDTPLSKVRGFLEWEALARETLLFISSTFCFSERLRIFGFKSYQNWAGNTLIFSIDNFLGASFWNEFVWPPSEEISSYSGKNAKGISHQVARWKARRDHHADQDTDGGANGQVRSDRMERRVLVGKTGLVGNAQDWPIPQTG